ncbi:hypothetical protein CPC08DRAFT_119790 [Agrocybe pediades]|nr:hypothetical protein CPC08DRAFT_119790 [Agrocybe pediades]
MHRFSSSIVSFTTTSDVGNEFSNSTTYHISQQRVACTCLRSETRVIKEGSTRRSWLVLAPILVVRLPCSRCRNHTLMNAMSTFNSDPRNMIHLHSSSKIIPIERVFEGDGEEYYPFDTYALALEADRNEGNAWV